MLLENMLKLDKWSKEDNVSYYHYMDKRKDILNKITKMEEENCLHLLRNKYKSKDFDILREEADNYKDHAYIALLSDDYCNIKNYLEKLSLEAVEDISLNTLAEFLKEFKQLQLYYIDPKFLNDPNFGIEDQEISVGDSLFFIDPEDKKFKINFDMEESVIKKKGTGLFDYITGLDKDNNLTFINITITNLISNQSYKYNFTLNEELKFSNKIFRDQYYECMESFILHACIFIEKLIVNLCDGYEDINQRYGGEYINGLLRLRNNKS